MRINIPSMGRCVLLLAVTQGLGLAKTWSTIGEEGRVLPASVALELDTREIIESEVRGLNSAITSASARSFVRYARLVGCSLPLQLSALLS